MRRVLQVFGKLGRGGLEAFVMNLYRAIDRNQIQFDFLLTAKGGDYEEEAKKLGAEIYYTTPRSNGMKAYKSYLDDFFAKNAARYSAIHLHASSLSSIEPLKYAKKYGIPIRIIHSHSSSVKQNLKGRIFHHILHNYNKLKIRNLATHYMGCSDKALDWLFKGTGVRSKAVMINNGIDSSQYRFNESVRKEMREAFGFKDDFVIGHVGSFIHVKNHRFLISLFEQVLQVSPEAKLLLVGAGELESSIRQQILDLGMNSKVVFAGLRSDVDKVLQAVDLIIMPSLFEGLPVSLVEAQAAGLPIIASDTISKDVALTSNIHFISLNDPILKWIDCVKSIRKNYKRYDTSDEIKNKGFDIHEIAKHFCSIYNS